MVIVVENKITYSITSQVETKVKYIKILTLTDINYIIYKSKPRAHYQQTGQKENSSDTEKGVNIFRGS